VGSTNNAGRGENPVAPDRVVLPVPTRVPTQTVEAPVTAGGDCLMGLTREFPGSVTPSVPRRMAPKSEPPGARCQRATGQGFPLTMGGDGETPPPVLRDAGPEVGDMWGKPPVRGDTTPRHKPRTRREQSRNTPLGVGGTAPLGGCPGSPKTSHERPLVRGVRRGTPDRASLGGV